MTFSYRKLRSTLHRFFHSKQASLVGIVLLVAAIPLTVFIAQRQQEIRQRAQVAEEGKMGYKGNYLRVDTAVAKPGDMIAAYWDISSGGDWGGIEPAVSLKVNPSPVQIGNPAQIQFSYMLSEPTTSDIFVLYKDPPPCRPGGACPDIMRTKVVSFYANSCLPTPGTTVIREGVCTIPTQNLTEGTTYTIELKRKETDEKFLSTITFSVIQPQPVTLTVTPSSVPKGGAVTFQWKYNGIEPSPKDLIETFNSAGSHVADIYTSTCSAREGTTVNATGQCAHTTQEYIVGTFTVKFYRYGDRSEKYKMAETTFSVTAATAPTSTPTLTPTPAAPPAPTAQAAFDCVNQAQVGAYVFHVLWPTTQTGISAVQLATNAQFTGEVFTSRNIAVSGSNYIVKGPGGFDLNGTSLQSYFRVGTTYYVRILRNDTLPSPVVSFTVPSCGGARTLESVFKDLAQNVISRAYAIALPPPDYLTGREYMQLFRVEQGIGSTYAVGPKMWLNCEYQTVADIVKPAPSSPVYNGKCQYELPKDLKTDMYMLRIMGENEKVLAQSLQFVVSNTPVSSCGGNNVVTPNPAPTDTMITFSHADGSKVDINTNKFGNGVMTDSCKQDGNNVTCRAGGVGSFPYGSVSTHLWFQTNAGAVQPICTYSVTYKPSKPKGCMSDTDCNTNGTTGMKCMRYQDYPGSCQPEGIACAQVITRACRTITDACTNSIGGTCFSHQECVDFPNPCVVPPGWRTQPQASVTFDTSVQLTGIGIPAGNPTPKHPIRNFYLTIFDANNIPVTTQVGTLTFDASSGYFKGTIGYTYPYPYLCPPNAECAYKMLLENLPTDNSGAGTQSTASESVNETRVTATYKSACVPRPACLDTQPACAVDLQPGQTLCQKSCNTDSDCAGNQTGGTKCWKQGNYPGKCGGDVCTGNTVRACDPNSFCGDTTTMCDKQPVCDSFSSPCHVPPGWIIEEQVSPPSTSCPKPAIACRYGEAIIYGDPQNPNSCPVYKCLPPPNPVLNGSYTVKIWAPQFLRKQFPGIISIKDGATITLPSITMQAGDINGDNLINILDYNMILTCFGDKISSPACKQAPHFEDNIGSLADLNDDGVVNGTDYNLFLKSLASKEGD